MAEGGDWQDVPVAIKPGLYKQSTGYAARDRWIDGSNVRFVDGFPELIGGWAALIDAAAASAEPARGAHAWKTLANTAYLGYGTATKLNLMSGATVFDITPTSSFTAGTEDSSVSYGYGGGGYGSTPYGGVSSLYTVVSHALTWTHANWGEDLISCPRGQGIFVWDASVGTGTRSARIANSPPQANGIFVSDVDRTLVAYGAHSGYQSTVTITIAAPGVVTWTAHGHSNGDIVKFSTTGALPTGLVAATTYYIVGAATDTFQVSATSGGAAITTSGSQSGVHTATTSVADPLNVRWSSSEDYTIWRPSDANTAGSLRCEIGTECVGAMAANGGHLISTDQAIYLLRYVGAPFIYGMDRVAIGPSMISPHSGIQAPDGRTFWMGPRTFYVYDGTVREMECDVRSDVFDSLNTSQLFKVCCGTIRDQSEIIWFYPENGSTEVSACVAYNTKTGVWWQGTLARTSWIDRNVVVDYPVGWGADGLIYAQETGTNGNGTAITYSIETGDLTAGDGSYTRGRKLIPDYERMTGAVHAVEIDVRKYPKSSATTLGPHNLTSATTNLSVRARGRHVRLRFEGSDDFRMGQWQMRIMGGGGK